MANLIDDILSKGGEVSGADDIEVHDPEGHYRAFLPGKRVFECEIRSVHPVEHSLPYAYIYDTMAYSGDYSFFWVVTSFYVLKVKGRNLRPVVRAIRAHNCAWIQEFNKNIHTPPAPGEPVITHISIEIKPAGETFREASEGFKAPAAS